MDDRRLLESFVRDRSQAAFGEIVVRHRDWVYSVCVRRLGDSSLAEDATQAVFLALARKASAVMRQPTAGPWLHHAARFACAHILRARASRVHHELEAAMRFRELASTEIAWSEIEGELEPALDRLGARDREAIVLRYFEKKTDAQIGLVLGISESAAQKRVVRALERLRKMLVPGRGRKGSRGGDAVSAVALGGLLVTHVVRPVPAGLGVSLSNLLVAGPSPHLAVIMKGVVAMMAATKVKIAVVVAVLVVGGMVIFQTFGQVGRGVPTKVAGVGPAAVPKMMNLGELTAALEARNAGIKSIEWTFARELASVDDKPARLISGIYNRMGTNEYMLEQAAGSPYIVYSSDGKTMRILTVGPDSMVGNIPVHAFMQGNIQAMGGPNSPHMFGQSSDKPKGLMGLYILSRELMELLKAGRVTLTPRTVVEAGVACYELQGQAWTRSEALGQAAPAGNATDPADAGLAQFRMLLDPTRSLMPRRIEQYSSGSDDGGEIVDCYEYEEAAPGMWFPIAARQRGFRRNGAEYFADLLWTYQIRQTVVSVNTEIPEVRFRLVFPEGTKVYDYTEGMEFGGDVYTYTMGRSGEKVDYRKKDPSLTPTGPQRGLGGRGR